MRNTVPTRTHGIDSGATLQNYTDHPPVRILFTGASSVIGSGVLNVILESCRDVQVWCIRHRNVLTRLDPRVCVVDMDLTEDGEPEHLPDAIDLVVHFAGVSHAQHPRQYWDVNFHGTMRVAKLARARGCKKFVYISTRCATQDSGAYGESKLAAESELRKLPWDSLLIVRPSEIYGGEGQQGIDRLISLALRRRFTPLLLGDSRISFAPLSIDDFIEITGDEIRNLAVGVKTIELCGPEDLSPSVLATRMAIRHKAWRLPVWWPLLSLILKTTLKLRLNFVAPDQLKRLTCDKTSSSLTADRIGRRRFLID